MTTGCGWWTTREGLRPLILSFRETFRVLFHRPVQPTNITFHRPLCVHDISPACNDGRNTSVHHIMRNMMTSHCESVSLAECCQRCGNCKTFCGFEAIPVMWSVSVWMLCSVFLTHMALSHPWGISSSGLM